MAKPNRRMVTPMEVEKFIKLYEELGSYEAVAKKCHRTAATVSRHIKNIESGSLSKTSLRYIALYEKLGSYAAVGRRVNKSPQTVARIVQSAQRSYVKTQNFRLED